MSTSKKHGILALALCAALIVAMTPVAALAYIDAGGGTGTGPFLPYTQQPSLTPDRVGQINALAYLPYTDQYQLPADAHGLGVHMAKEQPGSIKYGGRALLDDTQSPGKTVLIVKNGSLYQVSH